METLLINLGYGLMLAALLTRDILWLRIMVLTAQSSLAIYGWSFGEPNVAVWNSVFVLINGVQIALIFRDRRPVQLDDIQQIVYNCVSASMSKRDFLAFWEMGSMKALPEGRLIREGDTPQDLLLLIEGEVSIRSHEKEITSLGVGQFVAEMSFISGESASADVVVESPIKYLAWSQDKLRSLRVLNPHLFILLQGLLGKDLARKIRSQNKS